MAKHLRKIMPVIALLLVFGMALGDIVPARAYQVPVPGDPAQVLGKPNGQDTFDSTNNWTLFDEQCFKSEITDGKYVMTAKGIKDYSCWEVSWPTIANYYLETVVQTPDACDANDRFGLFFRAPDNYRGYLFGLTCDGRYYLNVFDGQLTTELVRPASSPAIMIGNGQLNRIGVMAYGSKYILYANGAFLTQIYDYTFTQEGKIGYFVRAASEQPFTVQYDDLKVWLLNDEYYPPQVTPPPLPPVTLPPPTQGAAIATANVNVNLRSGPGMQFSVYGVAPQGASGEVVGVSPDGYWWVVKVPPTISGSGTAWVSAPYVSIEMPSSVTIPVVQPPLLPPQIVVPPPSYGVPYVSFNESAVVRSGPSPEYPVYGVTSVGARVEVAGKSQDGQWWAIKLPLAYAKDGLGWVYRGYVSAVNTGNVPVINAPELPKNITPDVPGSGAPAAITIEPINVRSGPGNAYESYGKVPIGTIMAVSGVSPDGEFYVIKLPTDIASDSRGWVPARYVQASNVSKVPVVQPPTLP